MVTVSFSARGAQQGDRVRRIGMLKGTTKTILRGSIATLQ
jgi:hypothetical protein